jgi:hypothetical protein
MARKGTTVNPKFKGGDAARVKPRQGQNVGGITDAEVRDRIDHQSVMLKNQLKSNKSGSSPL